MMLTVFSMLLAGPVLAASQHLEISVVQHKGCQYENFVKGAFDSNLPFSSYEWLDENYPGVDSYRFGYGVEFTPLNATKNGVIGKFNFRSSVKTGERKLTAVSTEGELYKIVAPDVSSTNIDRVMEFEFGKEYAFSYGIPPENQCNSDLRVSIAKLQS